MQIARCAIAGGAQQKDYAYESDDWNRHRGRTGSAGRGSRSQRAAERSILPQRNTRHAELLVPDHGAVPGGEQSRRTLHRESSYGTTGAGGGALRREGIPPQDGGVER